MAKNQLPFGVPKTVVLLSFAMLNLLTGIAFFGYLPLVGMLLKEGAFKWKCPAPSGPPAKVEAGPCDEQTLVFGQIWDVSLLMLLFSGLAWGITTDWLGPKINAVAGQVLFLISFIALAFAGESFVLGYWIGLLLMAFAGGSTITTTMNVALLFPTRAPQAISLMTGSYDFSAGVFAIMEIVHSSVYPKMGIKSLLLGYSIVCVACLIIALVFVPFKQFEPEDIEPETQRLVTDQEAGVKLVERPAPLAVDHSDMTQLQKYTSLTFIMFVAFFAIEMFRMSFFMPTGPLQFGVYGDEKAAQLSKFFGIIFPFCGLTTFPMGWLATRYGNIFSIYLANATGVLHSLLCLLMPWTKSIFFAYANIIVFPMVKSQIFSTGWSIAAGTFGFVGIGTLMGTAALVAGAVSQGCNPLAAYTTKKLNGNFVLPNEGILVAGIIAFAFPIFMTILARSQAQAKAAEAAAAPKVRKTRPSLYGGSIGMHHIEAKFDE
ncbi:unnamed protein product [Vitrella brassicaformis CCMP3155]|uniref:Major facilitator superfamily (MFS) profile domain-containing protein n=1 Tax=Vitrella brassicaformis (strain CCMP3155) TaxID=1169540 RepID=A0A0G4GGJ1_VITBC|nr:unnamed protein product [Vitrella brassicaformis CCMP3155]|eukprot:CEM28474.1 unnamed protein product [Vitrella brassicaformis CCMP3155]